MTGDDEPSAWDKTGLWIRRIIVHRLWMRHDRNKSAQSPSWAQGHQQGRSPAGTDSLWPTVALPSAHTDGKAHDTGPTLAMLRTAGVEELTVHADARHGDLLEQMR